MAESYSRGLSSINFFEPALDFTPESRNENPDEILQA